MKIDPAVREETARVAAGTLILTVLMIAVFLILGKFDHTVLLGALLGCATAIGNFFLMALTVQHLTGSMPVLPKREEEEASDGAEESDEEQHASQPLSAEAQMAGRKMQLSFILRLLLMGLVAVLALKTPVFHPVAALLPLLFPNLVIALIRRTIGKGA